MIFTVSFSLWHFGWNILRKLHKGKGREVVERAWTFYIFIFKESSFPTGQKKSKKMRGAAGSCVECEMFVLCSAVALWQHVLNWLQMCEESKRGGLCSSRSSGCKATFTGLNWQHVSPEQGGESQPASPAADLVWHLGHPLVCVWGIEQRQSCDWKFPAQFHLSEVVCAHECITFPILTSDRPMSLFFAISSSFR